MHFLDDAVSKALRKAALNRQEKICVHHICDRLRHLMEEFKPQKQNTEYILDISKYVFDLVRELQCSCCREMISKPRIMRCGHAFCYHCIKHWFEVTKYTDCPQCRHMEITGNVEKLPHLPVLENILRITDHLANIVSKARYNKTDKPPKPSCAICTARPGESAARDAAATASSKERAENTNDLTHSLTERDDKESADRRRQRSSAVSEKLWYDVDLRLFLCSWCYEKQSMRAVDMHHQHPVYLDLLQDITGESIQFCETHNFQVKSDFRVVTTLDITHNKLNSYSEFYNLINWPTKFSFYTVSNQLQEKFFRDVFSSVRVLASARFLISPTQQVHTRAVT
jgi:hypothetical protein